MGDVDVSVKWPFKWCLVGSSGSGKTIFSLNLVKNIHRIVDIPPTKIVLIFKEYQKIYDEFKKYFPTEMVHEEEADIDYITKENKERMLLICDDLYFSKKGKGYRSLGDQDITFPIKSDAKTVNEIIEELKVSKVSERSGRAMDHEEENVFEKLRSRGYM